MGSRSRADDAARQIPVAARAATGAPSTGHGCRGTYTGWVGCSYERPAALWTGPAGHQFATSPQVSSERPIQQSYRQRRRGSNLLSSCMSPVLRIALLIETSREYARGLLRGVARYQQQHGPWSVYFEPHGLDAAPPAWLRTWKGDGILARINDHQMANAIVETGIPAVDVRGAIEGLDIPFVGVENRPVAELAFDHLRSCSLSNFAFCGTPRGENPNQDRRCDFFVELVEQAGRNCHVFLGEQKLNQTRDWEDQQTQRADWLTRLPKPIGIMTCHDDRGHQVLDACRRAGFQAPDEVAVIGVDNDPHLCNLCTPPLTSIDVNSGRVGYEAAALLDACIRGAPPPKEPVASYVGCKQSSLVVGQPISSAAQLRFGWALAPTW